MGSGQADNVLVPYADFQPPQVPNKERPFGRSRDRTLVAIFSPLDSHGAVQPDVGPGSTYMWVAGAGPVGPGVGAAGCHFWDRGVIVGDIIRNGLGSGEASAANSDRPHKGHQSGRTRRAERGRSRGIRLSIASALKSHHGMAVNRPVRPAHMLTRCRRSCAAGAHSVSLALRYGRILARGPPAAKFGALFHPHGLGVGESCCLPHRPCPVACATTAKLNAGLCHNKVLSGQGVQRDRDHL